MAPISIRPWSGLIDFERFTVSHTSGFAGGLDFIFTWVPEGRGEYNRKERDPFRFEKREEIEARERSWV